MNLPAKLLRLHHAFSDAGVPHAFGGAIALAYATLDPRGTSDIDVNIFVDASEARGALSALPAAVDVPPETADRIKAEGQVRLWWDETPIDLFFDYEAIHRQAAANRLTKPFGGEEIPVLGPVELAIFKAMFDRTRDWADLEAMASADTLDIEAVERGLAELVGADDQRLARLREADRRGSARHGDRAG